jgi:threonine dehydratase
MVSLDDITNARRTTAGLVRHTPLQHAPDLSRRTGADVFLKLENLQVTGSFKARGPSNKLQHLPPAERKRGVVAATAGNHGIGLSHAGRRLGIPVHIHIPESADRDKLEMLQDNGAILHFAADFEAAHFAALQMAESDGLTLVSAYSDPHVIASNGVVGLEILDDQPDIDLVIVPVGGGGLAAGIGLVMKAGARPIEVWGVEAANSPSFNTWFATGMPARVPLKDSIAEGLAGYIEPETLTWPLLRKNVDLMTTVSEQELVEGMRWMVTRQRMIVEPSGVAAIAIVLREGSRLKGRRVAAVVSGGNVAWARFLALVEGGEASGGGA